MLTKLFPRFSTIFLLVMVLAVVAGCQDPTADKPQATVSDAVEDEAPAEAPAPETQTDTPETTPTAETPEETETAEAPAPETTAPAEETAATKPVTYKFNPDLTPNTYIGFAGSKTVGTHYGQFPVYDGTVTANGDDLTTAKVDLTIDMREVRTDDTRLTGTLKKENFFHVEEHPQATFKTTNIEKKEGQYQVTGNLTIRGIAKSISFPARITLEGDTLKTAAEFSIDRNHWKIGQGWTSDVVIKDNVLIELEITAKKSG